MIGQGSAREFRMPRIFRALFLPFLLMLFAGWVPACAVTPEEVEAGAARLYRERIAQDAARHALDSDAGFLARVQRIAGILIAQARRDYPESATWSWELHTTTDELENAFCMAGGKLLVGQPFIARLGLNDAELAMLLAHEMQHALLQHNRKEFEEALRLDPSLREQPFAVLEHAVDHDESLMRRLEPLDASQEEEADREGLKLAWRAGWPARTLANYFRKAMRAAAYPNFERNGYPSPAQRWHAAQELAETLDPSR
jgi:predicted Zn-dependent protease